MAILNFMCEGITVKGGMPNTEQVVVRVPTFADADVACRAVARNRDWQLYNHHFVYWENRSELGLLGVC